MIKYIYSFFATVFLFGCSCNDNTKCDTSEPIAIDFRLEINETKQKLINLSQPTCLIKKIQWDFDGDGAWDSEEESPSLSLDKALGSVTLRINELNEYSKVISSNSGDLSVDFDAQDTGEVGEEIKFISTSNPSHLVNELSWDFGDGNVNKDDETEVSHTFNKADTYTVKLCVNEENCAKKTIIVKNPVSNPVPNPTPDNDDVIYSVDITMPTAVEVGEEVMMISNSSVSEGTIESHNWIINGERISGKQITYRFNRVGDFNVELCVDRNCKSEIINVKESTIPPDPDQIEYFVNISMPGTVEVGQDITMISSSSVSKGSISAHNWSINGEQKSGKQVSYKFNRAGDFNVKLCVNGNLECTNKTIRVNKVDLPPAPSPPPAVCKVDFAIPSQVDQCEKIELNAISKDDGSRFEWIIGNDKKSGKNVTYDFKKPGNYTINLCNKSSSDCCVSKSIIVKEVIEEVDEFYGNELSKSIGTYTECDKKEWVSESIIKIKPSQSISLDKAVLWSSGGGKVILFLEYVDACGETISNALTRYVNNGRTELLLNKFLPLSSNLDYVLRIEAQDDIKMLSNYNCNDMPNGDVLVKIDYKSGYSLFEIQYNH